MSEEVSEDVDSSESDTPKTGGESSTSTDGDAVMKTFVVDDITAKIKLSASDSFEKRTTSPRSGSNYSLSSACSESSVPNSMATSISSQMFPSPTDVPEIDPRIILDIEILAKKLSTDLDIMLKELNTTLQRMSALTVGSLQTHRTAVEKTCDTVDVSIKSMYALMAKSEELSTTMRPLSAVAKQIREIRRLVDLLEMQIITNRSSYFYTSNKVPSAFVMLMMPLFNFQVGNSVQPTIVDSMSTQPHCGIATVPGFDQPQQMANFFCDADFAAKIPTARLTQKSSKPQKSRKRSLRVPNPVSIARRNERERNRVKLINSTFSTLRQCLPSTLDTRKKRRLSKVDILRHASKYIETLASLLGEKESLVTLSTPAAVSSTNSDNSTSDQSLSPLSSASNSCFSPSSTDSVFDEFHDEDMELDFLDELKNTDFSEWLS